MGARWARGSLQYITQDYRQIPINVDNRLLRVMGDIAESGAEEMQQNIEDRGTEYSLYRATVLGRGTTGRHDTGTMVEAVEHRVEVPVPHVVNAMAGWLDEFLTYFGLQEKGTEYIPAMHALRDAGDNMRARLKEEAPSILRNARRRERYAARKK